ncbi:monovalent cation/H(+) antiporter subunit G [Agromyces sp. SYSU T00266]
MSRLHAATKPQVLGLAVVLLAIVLRVPIWGIEYSSSTVPVSAGHE